MHFFEFLGKLMLWKTSTTVHIAHAAVGNIAQRCRIVRIGRCYRCSAVEHTAQDKMMPCI